MNAKATYQELKNEIKDLKKQQKISLENYAVKCDEKYHSLFNNMVEGFAQCKMLYEHNKPIDFRYIEVNNAFEKLTGLKNVKGKLVSEILVNHKIENPLLFNVYDRVAKTGISERIETYVASLDTWFAISVYSSEKGEFLVIFDDITDHKKTEIAITKSESCLKELNATKDKFFSIIAHDLRSPFSGILGLSELLKDKLRENDISKSEKYATLINSSAKSTLILLDNLLNWARTQTKQINFTPEKIVLSSAIQKVIETSKSSAILKNISLNYTPSDEIEVFADVHMLTIILQNLISNAIKFTKIGGQIIIKEKLVQNEVKITISDNGIGMKKKQLKKLFRLTKSNTTLGTENEKGSGLGLVLCKEFVEKNDGIIWAKSSIGKGSDFNFTLPIVQES
ncbi:PAS domain-containing sensor histidine kinase [Lutibacter sp.]|uniref:PAS domain-containing sensor histidine kinase n=1 Tax=Lutibacter sp. TaxID=1925666 RepID=UPI001A186432|nr:PAS domain-containing sensor histidine kinase [Lutibacter sp.]MBI9041442.1 hypothetical protein [Lutibacter sp.]